MSLLTLIPADDLGAFFDPPRRKLTLSASGKVGESTFDIHFIRIAWEGGLAFELVGFVGPLAHTGKEKTTPYTVEQSFSIYPHVPKVIIRDANHKGGTEVEIHWGGLTPPLKDSGITVPSFDGSHGPVKPRPSFLDNVKIAIREVQKKYPEAELTLVKATPQPPRSIYTSNELSSLEAIFLRSGGSVTIKSTEPWGTWGEPTETPILVGVSEIHIAEIRLEPQQADEVVRQAGLLLKFKELRLSRPLTFPPQKEPYYVYVSEDGELKVGATSGHIYYKNGEE